MLLKFEIRPNVGSPLELNTTDINGNHLYPLSDLDITTNMDERSVKKIALPGEWPTFSYPDAMTIHVEGRILGIGATDDALAASYVTQRLALVDAVLPPIQALTSRKHGVIRIRMQGMTEDADADVVALTPSIPVQALYPAYSEFMLTFKSFEPYFVGVSTSTKYQLG